MAHKYIGKRGERENSEKEKKIIKYFFSVLKEE